MAHAFLTLGKIGQAQAVASATITGLEQWAEREPLAAAEVAVGENIAVLCE